MGIPVWRPVIGYEGLYEVSSDGRVKSLFRYKKELKPNITKNGYATVELFKEKTGKRLLIHRLVAMAFLPNPNNLPQVNHIDENKVNKEVSSVEWTTAKENMNFGTRQKRQLEATDYSDEKRKIIARENGRKACKPIIQITKEGNFVNRFDSGKEASKATGIRATKISDVLNKRAPSAGGFIWKYEKEE